MRIRYIYIDMYAWNLMCSGANFGAWFGRFHQIHFFPSYVYIHIYIHIFVCVLCIYMCMKQSREAALLWQMINAWRLHRERMRVRSVWAPIQRKHKHIAIHYIDMFNVIISYIYIYIYTLYIDMIYIYIYVLFGGVCFKLPSS